MAHWLNKRTLLLLTFILNVGLTFSQEKVASTETPEYEDYKDPEQFDKFNKRRKLISAWQINELKTGAIVVRLKTNRILIDDLIKQGNEELAREKELELYAINKNTMYAYLDNLTFCKVYFMYSGSSDSLLKGIRSGIFLDTTLAVNPNITMTESFYIISERDYAYNSSIGFVKEDSAKKVIEKGNPVKEMAAILKNKYGHQLKGPFPYYVKEKNFMDLAGYDFPIKVTPLPNGGNSVTYIVNRNRSQDFSSGNPAGINVKRKKELGETTVKVKKQFTYEKLSLSIEELDSNLKQFYQENPKPDISRAGSGIKSYLY